MVGVGGWTKCKGGDIDKWQGKRVRDKSKFSFLKVLLTWHYVTSTATSTVTGSHVGTHHSGDKLIKLAIDFCEPYVLDSFLAHTHQEQWSVTEGDFFSEGVFSPFDSFGQRSLLTNRLLAITLNKSCKRASDGYFFPLCTRFLKGHETHECMQLEQRDKQIQIVPVTICLIRIGALIPYQS